MVWQQIINISTWTCQNAFSWWWYEGLGGFHNSVVHWWLCWWCWCHGFWTPALAVHWCQRKQSCLDTFCIWNINVNHPTLFPISSNVPILLPSSWLTAAMYRTQQWVHLHNAIFAAPWTGFIWTYIAVVWNFEVISDNLYVFVYYLFIKQHFQLLRLCSIEWWVDWWILNWKVVLAWWKVLSWKSWRDRKIMKMTGVVIFWAEIWSRISWIWSNMLTVHPWY